jgi:hypothetical protein
VPGHAAAGRARRTRWIISGSPPLELLLSLREDLLLSLPGRRPVLPNTLGRAELERAFTALGERLARRGVVADVFVMGGAAMALAYDATA